MSETSNPVAIAMPSVAETIRDKVRITIMSTIPDEQINALIKTEWDAFFQIPSPKDRWDNTVKPSKFQEAIQKEIHDFMVNKVRLAVQEEVNKFQTDYNSQAKLFIGEFVKEYAPIALQGIATGLVASAMTNIQSQMYTMQAQFNNGNGPRY